MAISTIVIVVGAIAGGAVVAAVVSVLIAWYIRRGKNPDPNQQQHVRDGYDDGMDRYARPSGLGENYGHFPLSHTTSATTVDRQSTGSTIDSGEGAGMLRAPPALFPVAAPQALSLKAQSLFDPSDQRLSAKNVNKGKQVNSCAILPPSPLDKMEITKHGDIPMGFEYSNSTKQTKSRGRSKAKEFDDSIRPPSVLVDSPLGGTKTGGKNPPLTLSNPHISLVPPTPMQWGISPTAESVHSKVSGGESARGPRDFPTVVPLEPVKIGSGNPLTTPLATTPVMIPPLRLPSADPPKRPVIPPALKPQRIELPATTSPLLITSPTSDRRKCFRKRALRGTSEMRTRSAPHLLPAQPGTMGKKRRPSLPMLQIMSSDESLTAPLTPNTHPGHPTNVRRTPRRRSPRTADPAFPIPHRSPHGLSSDSSDTPIVRYDPFSSPASARSPLLHSSCIKPLEGYMDPHDPTRLRLPLHIVMRQQARVRRYRRRGRKQSGSGSNENSSIALR